jgi:hypothetical protein
MTGRTHLVGAILVGLLLVRRTAWFGWPLLRVVLLFGFEPDDSHSLILVDLSLTSVIVCPA